MHELRASGYTASGMRDDPSTFAASLPDGFATSLPDSPGAHIGPYSILQILGEGGFGTVYVAHQDHRDH